MIGKKVKVIVANEAFTTFWAPHQQNGYLGQWWLSDFEITEDIISEFPNEIKSLNLYVNRYDVLEKLCEQQLYSTAEKFMMMAKSALFRDNVVFEQMSHTDNPKQHKSLGRKVANFTDEDWDLYCIDIVKIGNYLKFTQNEDLKAKLISTQGTTLVEGSPLDKIWGVGLRFDDPHIENRETWKGTNYLGICLMFVRDLLI